MNRCKRAPLVALIASLVACGSNEPVEPGSDGSGSSAGMATAGTASAAGHAPGPEGGSSNAGTSGAGGDASGGTSSGGAAVAGASGNATGGNATGGNATGGNATGGSAIGGGPMGGASTASDRCDVANYDAAKPPKVISITGNLGTHDPVMIAADGRFYLFSTGDNIGAKTSADMLSWQAAPDVLSANTRPTWLAKSVPGVSNLWAPDISFFGGKYHLYYSASTFGSNRSCIGHLTRASLSSGSWADQGKVICSNVDSKDNWNAIDPNVVLDESGAPWLAFGSFWSGIKLIKLDDAGARSGTSLDAIASRPSSGGALEAPFIVRRCGYYYLFDSWDTCCKGASSTYNIRVARSKNLQGPYVDKSGVASAEGGGTLVLQGGDRYKGPGHNAVVFTPTGAFNVYHSYDANNNGASVLRISELVWDSEGWPLSAGP